jgi:two-component system, NtrC family, response regulator GlrR
MRERTSEPGPRILVVDDDEGLLELIVMRLAAAGYEAMSARTGAEALEQFRRARPRVVISDLRMEGMDGHALFSRLHAEAPTVPMIILTAHGTIADAVAATQRGVFGFLTKPFDSRGLLDKVAEAMAVSPEVDASVGADAAWRAQLVSSSVQMDELLRRARRAADLDCSVLISGPRSSGKELLARAMHATSARAGEPLLAIRCADLDQVKRDGSDFANALAASKSGVLLLKGIEDLPPREQSALLLVLRKQPSAALGAPTGATDIRVIATTAQPLDSAIRDGRFRAELFYALGQVVLNVPALADRRQDVPALVAHFSSLSRGIGRGFSPEATAVLQEASWPGNVGQLRSVVERALALSVTPQVSATLVRGLLRAESEREMNALSEARRVFEHEYLVNLLETTGGNITRAARIAQRNRTEFYKLLARHNIDPVRFK